MVVLVRIQKFLRSWWRPTLLFLVSTLLTLLLNIFRQHSHYCCHQYFLAPPLLSHSEGVRPPGTIIITTTITIIIISITTITIANFSIAFNTAFTLLEKYRSNKVRAEKPLDQGSSSNAFQFSAESNQAIMLITDGIPSSEDDVFQEHNQPHKVIEQTNKQTKKGCPS